MKIGVLWALVVTCSALHATGEQPLIISVCAYNASPWVEQNLDSLFMQEYSNFHVVYVDDASTDDTVHKVQSYIATHHLEDKITLISNATRQRKMKNIYTMFHQCPDDAIIAQVDADDWLDDATAFAQINAAHQEEHIWLTYGQFKVHPSGQKGYCRQVPDEIRKERAYRKYSFIYTHMRTFRSWLVKYIKLQDLITETVPNYLGRFFPISNDNAIYFPMLEMCGDRFAFIPNILYVHNHSNPNYGLHVDFDLSIETRKDIRTRDMYPVLHEPVKNRADAFTTSQAHLIILSQANPCGLEHLLSSLEKNAHGISNITVLYEVHTHNELQWYKEIRAKNSSIDFISCNHKNTYETIVTVVEATNSDHLIIARDRVELVCSLNVTQYIQELEKTFAYGYYFNYAQHKKPFYYKHIHKEMIPSQHIWGTTCAWKFNCGLYALYNNIDMTLLRKRDVLERLASLKKPSNDTMQSFLDEWHAQQFIDGHMVGLFSIHPLLIGKRTSILTPAVSKPTIPLELQNFYRNNAWLQPNDLIQECMCFLE